MYIADKCSTDIAYIIAKPRLSGGSAWRRGRCSLQLCFVFMFFRVFKTFLVGLATGRAVVFYE